MYVRRNPLIAHEGIIPMLLVLAAGGLLIRYVDPWMALVPGFLFVFMFFLFRDPEREVPSVALGVVSPVDGEVEIVDRTDRCVVQGEAHRVRIRIDAFGTYTARSPIEGSVMDLHSRAEGVGPECPANALWLRNDQGHSVVLQFDGYRLGLAPRSFYRFGERVGQGHRCAYLRLVRFADIYMPINGSVRVNPGQKVTAGSDLIGTVPHP